MATINLDLTKLRCPQPILKLTAKSAEMKPGEVLEVMADSPTFVADLKVWCERVNKKLLSIQKDESSGVATCQIAF
jgi:tRNA 2-thiouridine synthesizing protein A